MKKYNYDKYVVYVDIPILAKPIKTHIRATEEAWGNHVLQ